MVQLSVVKDGADEAPAAGIRGRNRLARHRSYLQAALHLVFEEGLDALTMQKLADTVGAAVGTVYTYFPSKGALVAEVQREAVERLAASATVLGRDVEHAVGGKRSRAASLAPVVAFGRFWLTCREAYAEETHLLLLLLADATEAMDSTDAARVVPAVLRLLDLAEHALDQATTAGALSAGETDRRTVALAAALTGCVQLEGLRKWNPDLIDPRRTGRAVLDALLTGWGADPRSLAQAHAIVDNLEGAGPLARPLTQGDPE